MDTIFIHNLIIEACIGTTDEERATPQPLHIDLEVKRDLSIAAKSDQLSDTMDYQHLCDTIAALAVGLNHLNLIEAFADRLITQLVDRFNLQWIRLTLRKPQAITNATAVGITIERSYV